MRIKPDDCHTLCPGCHQSRNTHSKLDGQIGIVVDNILDGEVYKRTAISCAACSYLRSVTVEAREMGHQYLVSYEGVVGLFKESELTDIGPSLILAILEGI